MKKIIYAFFVLVFSGLSLQSANADPTYAVLDASGNVTNVIVCGAACAGGTFGGQKVVLQVAADPITNANRGGVWQGPGTTTYNNGTFTVYSNTPVINSVTETETDGSIVTSSAVVNGSAYSFTYQDTLTTDVGIAYKTAAPRDNTSATISVTKDNQSELLSFESRKTSSEVSVAAIRAQLNLINSKIQLLLDLLGPWIK